MKFIDYIIREKSIEPSLDFLEKDNDYSEKPYMFVNSKGIILGYTKGFKEKNPQLKINSELIGQSYLTILKGYTDISDLKRVRKFFNTYEEKEFDLEVTRRKEKIDLHVIKKPPVLFRNLDLGFLGRKKEIDAIAFIPIYIESIGTVGWLKRRFSHEDSLEKLMEKTEEEKELEKEAKANLANVHAGLIRRGWDAIKIAKIMDKVDIEKSYLYFKSILSKLEKKEEKNRKRNLKKKPT